MPTSTNPHSLLLLPCPPTSLSLDSLRAAYGPALKVAFHTLKSSSTNHKNSVLEILLPCPQIVEKIRLPRSVIFSDVSSLLAGFYSLSSIIAAEQGIATDGPTKVDVRVILLSYEKDKNYEKNVLPTRLGRTKTGPIIDLPTFASARRNWQYIFHLDGEEGVAMYIAYMELAARLSPAVKGEKRIITGGISMLSQETSLNEATEGLAQEHSVVAVGGTFDHLHAGHKLLLTATALLLQPKFRYDDPLRRLIIGVTGDQLLVNKKHAEYMQSWKERQDDVVDFLLTILSFPHLHNVEDIVELHVNEPVVNGKGTHTLVKHADLMIECVEIQDPFGPTITDESITALAVSGETRSGGAAVNDKRKEKDWPLLEVFEVDVLNAQTDGSTATSTEAFASKISSSAIRERRAQMAKQSVL